MRQLAKEMTACRCKYVMKIVLQDLKTLEYVYGDHDWTPHEEAAIGFSGPTAAADYAIRFSLAHVRVALKFSYPAHNIDFPALQSLPRMRS